MLFERPFKNDFCLMKFLLQGVQYPEGMKLPDFSLTFPDFPDYDLMLVCVQDCLGGQLSQKISTLEWSYWLKMNLTKQDSLTFP